MESEERVWRRCRPVGALSMACTLAEVNLASDISLVCESLLSALIYWPYIKVLFIVQAWCLNSVTRGCTLPSGSVVNREGDSYSLVESFVVHFLFVDRAGPYYNRKHTLLVFPLVLSPIEQ
jgi:hypothetical protein